MQTLETLRQSNDYNVWANGEILQFFQSSNRPADEKAVRVLNHVLWTEAIWLRRMLENLDTTGFDFHAGETIADAAQVFANNRQNFSDFFAELNEEELETVFRYKNSRGVFYENTFRDGLTHVFFHSQYHRGQVAQAIRSAGDAPPYTDFIQFLRLKQN